MRDLLVPFIMLILAALFFVLWVSGSPAMAQTIGQHPKGNERHWYDASCCSNRDCEPLPHEAVTEVKNGYMINYVSPRFGEVHEFYPASQARDSQDGLNHICFYYYPLASGQRIRCFYRTVNY